MADFASTLAQMYAQRPQFQVNPINPARMPDVGSQTAGWAPVGEAFGKGISDVLANAFVAPRTEAMKNQALMSMDPNTQYNMMSKAYDMYNSMSPEIRERIKTQPGHQALLKKWSTLFPGVAPITQEGGMFSFAPKVTPIEQQKGAALEKAPNREELLTAGERENLAKVPYYGAETDKTREETQLFKVRRDLYPKEAQAEIDLKGAQAAASRAQAELSTTKAGFQDPVTARIIAQMNAEDERAKRQERAAEIAAAAAAEKQAAVERAAQQKERDTQLRGALTAYHATVAKRKAAVDSGALVNKGQAVLDNANDLLGFINTTKHLEEAGPQQINLSITQLRDLAYTYEQALDEHKDPKYLNALREKAYDIYSQFFYPDPRNKTKTANALEHPEVGNPKRVKEFMNVFQQERTEKSVWGKTYKVPSNMGTINKWSTKLLPGGISSSLWD